MRKNIEVSFSEKYSHSNIRALEKLVELFVDEFYAKNSNIKVTDSFYEKIKKHSEYFIQKSSFFYSLCRDCKQILKEQTKPKSNRSEKRRIYIIRDREKNGKMIGFAIAYVSPNEFTDIYGVKQITDKEEPEEIIVGEKYVAYILPEYRTLQDFDINGKSVKPISKIAIGLNNMMEEWFLEEGVQRQYTSTGCYMTKNIIAYIANGFFVQGKSRNFVYMKRDVSAPINYKQRAFLVRSIKSGKIPTYNSSSEIPEYNFLEREEDSKKSSAFDEYVSVPQDVINKITNIGKTFRKIKAAEIEEFEIR